MSLNGYEGSLILKKERYIQLLDGALNQAKFLETAISDIDQILNEKFITELSVDD